MTALPTRLCVICQTHRPLRRTGEFREHLAPREHRRTPLHAKAQCQGSGKTPAAAREWLKGVRG